jgi:hypothetical protein
MWAALLIAADLSGTLTISDRTEARVRAPGTPTPSGVPAAAVDVETAPEARLLLGSRRVRFTLAYTPRLTLWDVGAGTHPTALHAGAAHLEWQSHDARLSIDQAGAYGGVSFAYVSLAPDATTGAPPRVDVVPAPQIIQYASSTTTLGSRLTLRRWTIDTSLGYRLDGGADAPSRAVLPFQNGPFGDLKVDYAVTRRDHLVTTVAASEAAFSSGPESIVTELDEGYRHFWTRTFETRLTLGVSEVRMRSSALAAHTFETYPVAEVVFEERPQAADGHLDLPGRQPAVRHRRRARGGDAGRPLHPSTADHARVRRGLPVRALGRPLRHALVLRRARRRIRREPGRGPRRGCPRAVAARRGHAGCLLAGDGVHRRDLAGAPDPSLTRPSHERHTVEYEDDDRR